MIQNVNVGVNHSVSTILRTENPDLVTVRCICHSLHLAAEEACNVLPRNLDFMVRETYNWFCHSTKRQEYYAELYKTITRKLPRKIVKLSTTRWLVRLECVHTILDQWEELKLHFRIANSKERYYSADQLFGMYNDDVNKLFLQFLSSTLKGVIELNKLFQSNSVDQLKLFEDLNNLLYSFLQNIVVPAKNIAKANV